MSLYACTNDAVVKDEVAILEAARVIAARGKLESSSNK
jgi:hypothetical protein